MKKAEYSFRLSSALKQLGRCVAYYPSLARLVGLKESIFLCQILYWSPRGTHARGPGWIYKSIDEVEEETGLSYREQKRLRGSLIEQNLLEETYDRKEHRLFFRVNTESLDALGLQLGAEHMTKSNMPHLTKGSQPPDETSGGTLRNVDSYKEHKITHEITQKPVCKKCDGSGEYPLTAHPGRAAYCHCPAGRRLKDSERELHFATAAGA